jgi:hypothetical protein
MKGPVGRQPQPRRHWCSILKPDRKHGSRVAYSFVMTSPTAAISIGSLLSFAPWASDRQKRKDGMATKRRKKTEDFLRRRDQRGVCCPAARRAQAAADGD